MVKITDKVIAWKKENGTKPFFSFEYFPPKTDAGVQNLYARLDKMARLAPMWVDVTWGAGGSSAGTTQALCENFGTYHGVDVLMHLTCTNVTVEETRTVLEWAKAKGIQNILALRGDPPAGAKEGAWSATDGGFAHAIDLVKYMRAEFGDYFCIGVAAYPEGHMDSPDKNQCFQYFKEKVNAGADFAVTQLFYDTGLYFDFCKRCKAEGINIDIFPGLMPIQSYGGFKRMTDFCSTYVPDHITKALAPIQNDDAAVKNYGINLGVQMGRELIEGGVPGLHMYTLNLETTTVAIIKKLGLYDEHKQSKDYPWLRPAEDTSRQHETVRPIFWAQRARSYVMRTTTWDDFPNGRFGNRDSPAYGEFDYYRCQASITDKKKAEWAFTDGITGLCEVFNKFLNVDGVHSLPWCPSNPGDETVCIKKQLQKLVKNNILPINSQPRVNGALSTDPLFGWGPDGGVVYQKAYVEFFCSKRQLDGLIAALKSHHQLASIEYVAVNKAGDVHKSYAEQARTTAVTWGIFPGQEVQQPTVVDFASFMAWKDEAFGLWHEWHSALKEEDAAGKKLLQEIQDEWFLVNMVDNNFLSGDMFVTLGEVDLSAGGFVPPARATSPRQ